MPALANPIANTEEVANLPEDQRQEVAQTALRNLDPEVQQEVVQQARVLPPPGQKTSDRIWTIIVSSFSIVLVGAFLALGSIAVGLAAKGSVSDVMLTVFTTAAGFLAGLLSPSPITSSSGRG